MTRSRLIRSVVAACSAAALSLLLVVSGGSAAPGQSVAGKLPKIESSLAALTLTAAQSGPKAAAVDAKAQGIGTSNGRVKVMVEAAGNVAAARTAVTAASGSVAGTSAGILRAWVPATELISLSQSSDIAYVRQPFRPLATDVTSLDYHTSPRILHALSWHANGWTGEGVKIAVVDVGFGEWQNAVNGKDLPAGVTTVDYCDGDFNVEPHGTDVASIVHWLAPDAELTLICVADEVGLAQAESYAASHGITIVNHSVVWPNSSRGDGNGAAGTPEAIVAQADADGILWVNAAGNQAEGHWMGTWVDGGNGGRLAFTPTHDYNRVSIYGGDTACFTMKWDDWPTTAIDYDLELRKPTTDQLVASSVTLQDGTQSPTEGFCYTAPIGPVASYNLVVRRAAGSASGTPRIDLYNWYWDLSPVVAESSVLEPATSPHAFSVGAHCYESPKEIEPFSSRGPTIDGRSSPDISGPDGVESMHYGGNGSCVTTGFLGTSAAAPHVVGAAALVSQMHPTWNASELRQYLQEQAIDMGDPGADNAYGAGRLSLPSYGTTFFPYALPQKAEVGGSFFEWGENVDAVTGVTFPGGVAAQTWGSDIDLAIGVPDDARSGTVSIAYPGHDPLDVEFHLIPKITDTSADPLIIGHTMSVFGKGLGHVTELKFGNSVASTFTIVSSTQIDAVIPPLTQLHANITATDEAGESGTSPITLLFTAAPKPSISSVVPTGGTWGSVITLTGKSLLAVSRVAFTGAEATEFHAVSDTQLDVTVPIGAQKGPILVSHFGGDAYAKKFTVLPAVTQISPASATVGSTVTLTGKALTGASVTLGKIKLKQFTVDSPSQITLVVPPGAMSGVFTVKTSGGQATSQTFSVLPTIAVLAPLSGRVGTSVKVSGQGLAGATSVTINGLATIFKANATSVNFKIPLGATSGPITVVTPAGEVTSAQTFVVTL